MRLTFKMNCCSLLSGRLIRSYRSSHHMYSVKKGVLKDGLIRWNVSLTTLKCLFRKKSVEYFRKRNLCREILFSLLTQSSFIHTFMITFRSLRELTIFIFLVIDITVLNYVWKYWKSAHSYVASDWGKIRWRNSQFKALIRQSSSK